MDPITWIAIISAILGYINQDEQASKQERALQKQADSRENDRRRQQDEAWRNATFETNELAKQAQSDMALFGVISGEYGGGNTVGRSMAVRQVQAGQNQAISIGNAQQGFTQLGFQGLSDVSQINSRMAAIDRPSLLGTALSIGNAYYSGQQRTNPSNKPSWTDNTAKNPSGG